MKGKRLLLIAIWLSWIALALIPSQSMAKDLVFTSSSGDQYTVVVPDEVPDFMDWAGPIRPNYVCEQFVLYIHTAANPENPFEGIAVLYFHAVKDQGKFSHLITIGWVRGTLEDPLGNQKFYIDKSFFETGIPTAKLEFVEEWPGLDEIIVREKRELKKLKV